MWKAAIDSNKVLHMGNIEIGKDTVAVIEESIFNEIGKVSDVNIVVAPKIDPKMDIPDGVYYVYTVDKAMEVSGALGKETIVLADTEQFLKDIMNHVDLVKVVEL